jgi:hypothetical protein
LYVPLQVQDIALVLRSVILGHLWPWLPSGPCTLDALSHKKQVAANPKFTSAFCILLHLQVHNIPRSSLFIQTKFTPIGGQDRSQPLPYDPAAPLTEQVRSQSINVATSLAVANQVTQLLDSIAAKQTTQLL